MAPQDATAPAGIAVIDAARRLLADFTRCPSCAAALPGNRCPACGIDLSGTEGRRIGELSGRAGQLLAERDTVLQVLRDRVRESTATTTAAKTPVPTPTPTATPGLTPTQASGPAAPIASTPISPSPVPGAAERSGLGVHGLLVGLGALLLSVAAVGFLVFSWRVLSLPGRAAVIGAATLGVLAVASWLRGRLPETAEAVGGLGVVLVLADAWAIRRTGLFGADRPEGLGYAAAAAAVCALLLGGWALASRVRAGSCAAVMLAPLAVLLLAARLDGELGPVPEFATGFLLIAGLALGRGLLPAGWSAERRLLRAIAAGALIGAGATAALGLFGSGRAALVLVTAAGLAAAQAPADRPAVELSEARSLRLRRGWSLAAGLLAGAAAVRAALALVTELELDGVLVLVPLTALPALAGLAAATVPHIRGAAIRRSAFGAGTVAVAALVTAPLLLLAGWLPLRAALAGVPAWSAEPGQRFGDLDPQAGGTLQTWVVVLVGLSVVGGCALLAIRISGWPGWLRRPVRGAVAATGGLGVIVLPLVPSFPVLAVVTGLTLLSVLPAALLVRRADRARASGSRVWPVAGWTVSGLAGTLAVLLAWSCAELSVALTALGIGGLLLARRRVPARSGPGTSAADVGSVALAGLAGAAAPFAVAAGAGLAGAGPAQRVVWAGLVGGLSAAALIGLPRGVVTARAGRAAWTGTDRLAAATGGLAAAVAGLLATLPEGPVPALDGAAWPRPALFAVLLLVALTGAVAVRPDVARALPVLAPVAAVAVTPLLGALAAAIRAAVTTGDPSWPVLSLLWALAAAVGGFATAAVVLSGRADPVRRLAAEFGVIGAGLIGLALVTGLDRLWPVLLVLGATAAAIAAAPDRRQIGWLAGLLLTGSTWSRLAVGNVTLVEAYSLPPALALLALALYRFYRAGWTGSSGSAGSTATIDPVRALSPVATVGLAPSVIVAAGGTPVRAAVLIAIGAVLVLAGRLVQRRGGLAPGAVLAGIGVLTAAATAVLRAGSTLSEFADQATAPLSGLEIWTVPAAAILLIAGLTVRVVQPTPTPPLLAKSAVPGTPAAPGTPAVTGGSAVPGGPLWPLIAAPPVLAALLLAAVPTLLAARFGVTLYRDDLDPWPVVRAAAVLGLAVLAALAGIADRAGPDRFRQPRTGLVPGAIALTAVAAWTGLTLGSGPAEAWTLPLAALLLIHGWSRFDRIGVRQPGAPVASWPAYGPGVAALLLPSLVAGWSAPDGSPLREIGLITLAAATLVIGARYRLQAPVLLGAGVLVVQSVHLLMPWIAALSGAVPLWGWLAAVGLGLIVLGARYEARVQQLRTIRLRLAALR